MGAKREGAGGVECTGEILLTCNLSISNQLLRASLPQLTRARPMPRGGETRCVPRFYVIGAMKAGTTTVSTWLHALGEPLSIRPKEVHFWPVDNSPRQVDRAWCGGSIPIDPQTQISRPAVIWPVLLSAAWSGAGAPRRA